MLTIKECSVIMRVSERTIRMLVKQNAIGSTRAGSGSCGKLLIPRSALLRYIDTL
ncbi:MAG: helix-turn-helix domain-containing protein [Oscillospiraceae bacterium]